MGSKMKLMFRISTLAWFVMTLWVLPVAQVLAEPHTDWVVYYSDKETTEAFSSYRLLVLDSLYHPPLEPLKAQDKIILGYISLGEVEEHRSYFKEVKKEGILLMENKTWKGSYFVDLRDKRWARRIVEDLAQAILHQGFDGLFLDTLDNPGYLEDTNPNRFKGMRAAAVNLLRTLREHYPNIPIMLNRAYDLYPDGGQYVDMILGESVFADYNFETKKYGLVKTELYLQQVDILKKAKTQFPHLQIYTLDYWNPEDPKGIKRIYTEQRKNGFMPYVATIQLNQLVPEPR